MTINEEDYLEHHGVLGMKWGHRKARDTKAIRKAKKNKYKKSPTKMYKHRDQFSDEEIQKSLKRMKLESELRNLSSNEMNYGNRISRGAKSVRNALGTIAGISATTYALAKTPWGQATISAGKKAFNAAKIAKLNYLIKISK